MTTRELIAQQCDAVKALLLKKNEAYGDSAISPLGVMAQGDPIELIAVRVDDKLSRIANKGGLAAAMSDTVTEDSVQDLIGYLVLAQIAYSQSQ